MLKQSQLIRADRRTLNSYDVVYNMVSKKPLFNHDDWVAAANIGDPDVYADALLKSDNINPIEFNKKYNLDYADDRTRVLALYTETGADRTNVDTKRKREIVNPDGTTSTEEYFASDYEYNLGLIRMRNDYNQQVRQMEMAQDIKDSMNVSEHILSGIIGVGTGVVGGAMRGVDNIVALFGGVGEAIVNNDKNAIDSFVESVASNDFRPFTEIRQDLIDFETNYTSIRDIDGNYSNWGKYVGSTATSIGEMLPSMLIGAGVGKLLGSAGGAISNIAGKIGSGVSQATFYAGMGAGNIQDTYAQYVATGADIDSSAILANAAIKSGLQWAVERGLGKVLGSTSLDNMVFGRTMSGASGSTLTNAGVKTIFKDVLQEGLEEVFQDTSDFLVDKGFEMFIKEFKGTSDISWQSLIDAFIIGGITSFAGSARNIITTKNVYANDKKLNKLASWQYGLNMESFVESLNEIDKATHHTDRYGQIGPKKFELSDKDRSAVQTAIVESYAAYRMITSIYSEIGEKRFKAANEVLNKITDKIKTGIFEIKDVNEYVDGVKGQLKGISESSIKKIAQKLWDDGVMEVEKSVKISDKSTDERKAADVAEMLGVDEVKITDGNTINVVEDKLIISRDRLDQESIGELLKHTAIKKLSNTLTDYVNKFKLHDVFSKAYKEYSGLDSFDNETLSCALLFDKSFFTSTLLNGNKDVYKLLSYFVQLTKDVKVGRAYDNVYKKTIEDAIENWCEALADYCSLHIEAQPDMFLFAISDKKKRQDLENRIRRNRIANTIYHKVLKSKENLSELTSDEINWLKNICFKMMDRTLADKVWFSLNHPSVGNRNQAMLTIENFMNTRFNHGYDGINMLPDISVANRVFNRFLKNINSTVSNFCKESSLTESDKNVILSEYGVINAQTIIKFRNEQFSEFTNKNYMFSLKPGLDGKIIVSIESNEKYLGGSLLVNAMNENITEVRSDMTGIDSVSMRGVIKKDILKDEYKDFYKFLTLNDLIDNPEILNNDTLKNIKKFILQRYNVKINEVTPQHVALTFNYGLKDSMRSLAIDSNGNYVVINLVAMKNMLTPNVNITPSSKIEDIVKKEFIPDGLNLKFVDEEEWKTIADPSWGAFYRSHKYDEDLKATVIDNTIYIPKTIFQRGQEDVKNAVLHELQHAIQFANNLDAGAGFWYDSLSNYDKKKIVKDFKKHMLHLFDGLNDVQSEQLVRNFGYSSTGEFIAFGLAGNVNVINFIPTHFIAENYKSYIILPWGKRYELTRSVTENTVSDTTIDSTEEYVQDTHIPNLSIGNASNTIISPIVKNKLAEDDPKAKDFISSEHNPNAKYKERYYVLNEDGTQKLHKNGTPVYHYVYDTETDRTRGRYVSKRRYAGTNLEYFNKKYTPLQMTKEMQNFVLSAEGLDPILQERINGSKAGTLTERDVMDYLRSASKIDDKTFKAINDAFFKNEYIQSFEDLQDHIDTQLAQSWALYRLIKTNNKMKAYEKMLKSADVDVTLLVEAIENNKDTEIAEYYGRLYSNFDQLYERSLNVKDEYARMTYMRLYDGTVESEWKIAANVRYVAIHNYNVTHKTSLPQDVVTEAYEEVIDDIPMNKRAMIEAIKTRELARKAKELVDAGENYRDHVVRLLQESEELEERLEAMSVSQIKRMYDNDGGIGKVLVEGVVAESTGEYISIPNSVPKITSAAIVNSIRGYLNTIRLNLTGKERVKFIKEHDDLFDNNLRLKKEVYQNAIPNKTVEGVHYRNKPVEDLEVILEKIATLKDEVLDNKRYAKEGLRVKEKRERELQNKIKRLERENEKLSKRKTNSPSITEFVVENEVIKLNTDVEIPYTIKMLLQTQYETTARTTVKNLTEDGERHVKLVSKSFYEKNAERLNSLTQGDIDNIVDFYLRANVSFNDINAPYIATEVWVLTYLIKAGRKGSANFVIDHDTLNKLESTLKNLQSTFGTGQVTWREALKELNPEVIISQAMAKSLNIEISKSDIESLLKAVESRNMSKVENEKNRIYTKYIKDVRNRRANRKKLDKALDKILQYERLAMLSGPGTWVRNWVSNQVIEGTNKLTDGMNGKLEKIMMKMFPKSQSVKNQYKIAGTKVTTEVSDYIANNLLNNGLLDMVMESLVKYDVRKSRSGERSVDILTDLIAKSVVNQFNSEHLSDNKIVTKIEDFIRTMISDNKSVKKAAIRYLGKMITEDLESGRVKSKTELLSQNRISKQFLNYVAEAYKLASYDYMHKSNFLMQLESQLARKSNGAYFIYKQLFPFAGASWNWFVEGLNYTPIGLAKSIFNFAKLEKTIEKMDIARQNYANNDIGVSSDFAKYLTLRNIGKGVIGSAGFVIGALLAAFGMARIDEEDGKYKLVVANQVYIDISDVFGTQGIFFGMSIFGAIRNKESAGDVFIAALDQVFLDSTFADVFNNFRYSQSFGDWLAYQPYSMLNMMIPNFIKTITSMSTPYDVKYSDGIRGKAEKLLVNAIPGISYAFPHYYDPYTGEKQVSYKLWGLTKAIDKLTPFGLSIYNVSDLEKLAIEYGVNKGQLTGRYTVNDDSITLNSADVEKLNQFYGKLNVASFKEIQSGQVVYKIKQSDGSYKKLRWQQMTDKEKAAIVSRTMTNNGGYAKIYILTDGNKYKYYATDSEYKELRSLGITKNVYRVSGGKQGFVKIS